MDKSKKQELLNKYGKFFAAPKTERREIFKGIRYLGNGTAYVSNTHMLLRIKDVSPFTGARTINAVTGAEIEGQYPDEGNLNQLLNWEPENQIILQGPELIAAITSYAKIAQTAEKELAAQFRLVRLTLSSNDAYLQVLDQGIEFRALIGAPEKVQKTTWALNADYVYHTLDLFKNAHSEILTINLGQNDHNPIRFSDEENGIDVLIVPVAL